MIIRTQATFSVSGDDFMPSKVAAPFSDTHNPGDIAQAGRFRGKPQPGGYASFRAPDEEREKIAWLHRMVAPLLPALRNAGADDFCFHITYYCDSGALSFTKEETRMIAEMECYVLLDCMIIEEEPIQPPQPTPVNRRG